MPKTSKDDRWSELPELLTPTEIATWLKISESEVADLPMLELTPDIGMGLNCVRYRKDDVLNVAKIYYEESEQDRNDV